MHPDHFRKNVLHKFPNFAISIDSFEREKPDSDQYAGSFSDNLFAVFFDKTYTAHSNISSKPNLTDNIPDRQKAPGNKALFLIDTNFKKGD